MARFLIVIGLVIVVIGLLWPYLSQIGLGRLPATS
jgi:multisubunit Na+/H+ antiporter MnhG subunit